jgi:hypothetical protein
MKFSPARLNERSLNPFDIVRRGLHFHAHGEVPVEATALGACFPDLWIPTPKPERTEALKVLLMDRELGEAHPSLG